MDCYRCILARSRRVAELRDSRVFSVSRGLDRSVTYAFSIWALGSIPPAGTIFALPDNVRLTAVNTSVSITG